MAFFRNLRFISSFMLAILLAGPALASISFMPCHQVASFSELADQNSLANEAAATNFSLESADASTDQSRCSVCAACCVALGLVAQADGFSFEASERSHQFRVIAPYSDSPLHSLFRPPRI